jgi:hypothetical protein
MLMSAHGEHIFFHKKAIFLVNLFSLGHIALRACRLHLGFNPHNPLAEQQIKNQQRRRNAGRFS